MIKDTSSQDIIITKSRSRRTWVIACTFSVLCVLSVLAYPSIANWSSSDRSASLSRARMAEVSRGEFIRDVLLQGNIVAGNSPKLYAPSTGTVTLHVDPGELVNKGDMVATVSSPSLTNQWLQELSTLDSLQIKLERQKIATGHY